MLTILKSGLNTQWCDSGRSHVQSKGYSQSGAVDWYSFQLANALCGNPLNRAALEIVAGNIEFTTSKTCLMAVAGAHSSISINGQLAWPAYRFLLQPNDLVTIGPVTQGIFTYLAFSAIVDLPVFGNSVCAVKREKAGGLRADGSAIANGDQFLFKQTGLVVALNSLAKKRLFERPYLSDGLKHFRDSQYAEHKEIPFSFCYQQGRFSDLEKQKFLAHRYTISHSIDSMGIRLQGPVLDCKNTTLVSQPMANGAIQIPGNGMPIVMRNNRQTIGGYPVIGAVTSAGLGVLSQASPGQSVKFIHTDFDSASISRQLIDLQLKQVLNNSRQLLGC